MAIVAKKAAFYRANPHRFCEDYIHFHLKWFQKIILFEMFHNDYTIYLAARGRQLDGFVRMNYKSLGGLAA